jgi:hypothetical protein
MLDRTFGDPTDDNDADWIRRRNDLVAELREAPRQSPAMRRFTSAVRGIADPTELRQVFAWLEQQGRSPCH